MLRLMHENARENLSQGCWKLPCNSPGTVLQTLRLAAMPSICCSPAHKNIATKKGDTMACHANAKLTNEQPAPCH